LKGDYIVQDIPNLLNECLEGTTRVKTIVNELIIFPRVSEDLRSANVNELLEGTIHIVWNELKYKAELERVYGDIPLIKCNPGQLNQVFSNLLVNAAQSIEKQGSIKVKTCHQDGEILVSISDTGCGIEPENLGRIYEPFFTTKEVGEGTGLGLSIAYEIIKKHHGDIKVESQVGKGTTFVLTLPVEVN
jgi:signal transduction histidine kinase